MQIGRVNGNLAVSRALGDFVYKDSPHLPEHAQKVSAEADLTIFDRAVWHCDVQLHDESFISFAARGRVPHSSM